MLPLEAYLRSKTSVPHRLNEFAILVQARAWRSQVEWSSHDPLAIKAGLPEAAAADLQAGRRQAGMRPDEAAVSGTYVTFARMLAVGRELPPDGSTPLPALAADGQAQHAAVAQ